MATGKYYTKTLTLPNGKRKYIRGKTAAEVSRKLEEAKRQIQQGIDISDNTTVVELAQLWFDTFKKPHLRESSQDTLRSAVNLYILPKLGAMRVRDVKPIHIQAVMTAISDKSHSVQSLVLSTMKAIFRLAVDNNIVAKVPITSDTKAGGRPSAPVVPLSRKQTEVLLKEVAGTRANLFVLLALYAGLRRGEAMGLKWEDIDFEIGTLHVQRSVVFTDDHPEGVINSALKTPAANRVIPLPLPVLSALATAQKSSKSEFVLSMKDGRHLTEGSFLTLWYGVNKPNPGFSIHPHQLRHTCITRWFEAGLDLKEVQYLAGHSTVQMTLSTYTHYDRESRAEETAEKIRAATPNLVMAL
jgi:integrase